MTPLLLILPTKNDHFQSALIELQKQKEWEGVAQNHPDLVFFNQEDQTFPISLVRKINQELQYSPYELSQRCFVLLHLEQASIPAQNALLKSLEEPPEYIQFIITTNQISSILPTIQSRCQLFFKVEEKITGKNDPQHTLQLESLYEKILSSSYSDLIDLAQQYKDRPAALELIEDLIRWLHDSNSPSPQTTQHLKKLTSSHQLLKQNVNVRLVLEDCFFQLKK